MAKNHFIAFRLSLRLEDLLKEAADGLDLKKTELARLLLTKSLRELKASAIKAGGYENIEFNIKEL